MTRKGSYSVELVDATTKEPLKEHRSPKEDIDAYVEVEPDLEYFIKVHNHSDNLTITMEFEVDGQDLGYNTTLDPDEWDYAGVWSFDKHTSISEHKALKCKKSCFNPSMNINQNGNKPNNNNENNNIGVVKVKIYEKIYLEGYYQANNFESGFSGNAQVQYTGSNQEDKKFLTSSIGNQQYRKIDNGMRRNSKKGQLLETITLKYCSTVGLIVDGVLPKPPLWDWYNMVNPSALPRSETMPKLEPITWTKETIDPNGNIIESKNCDLFDLTTMEDDDY